MPKPSEIPKNEVFHTLNRYRIRRGLPMNKFAAEIGENAGTVRDALYMYRRPNDYNAAKLYTYYTENRQDIAAVLDVAVDSLPVIPEGVPV